MVKLCLMASLGNPPPGLVLHQEQAMNRVIKDCQAYLPFQGTRQEVRRSDCLNIRSNQTEEPWKPISGLCDSNRFVKVDSTVSNPVLIDMADRPDSVLFSFGVAEQCSKHEKILNLLMSGSTEAEEGVLDLSLLSDLTGLETLTFDAHKQSSAPSLIYPTNLFSAQKALADWVGDMAHSSKITIHPDGRVLFAGIRTEMNDFLSVVAEYYLSKNSTKWRNQSVLIPHFDWWESREAQANIHKSSLTVEAVTVAPLKSPEKIKVKPLTKKKNNGKIGRERDLYKRNYFHACESLLSLMINNRRHGKMAFLSLKKSGPELPELLSQFSAVIAGTGLAVLLSVVCKVASGRVPFCAYKLFNTGLGFGLVWLCSAVNSLRDSIVHISKNTSKTGLEEEMMSRVDKSVNDIYYRAATLMVVAALRFA
ncbi:hypothetical protein Ddye_016687 [Dipteronia dyeriana]|uniref:Uncharacterized protein n=1 Tax=Dipteronia dyeriana TaxID=168575 RepID=A0AAD9U7V5_9ROSI|nr:hypothetical protein Ddye_016687 [Dipteronia dyeriana]